MRPGAALVAAGIALQLILGRGWPALMCAAGFFLIAWHVRPGRHW